MYSLPNFVSYLRRARRNRHILARIALNVSGRSHEFPVDISELRKLSLEQMAVTTSFLAWASLNPLPLRAPCNISHVAAWTEVKVRCARPPSIDTTEARDLETATAPRLRLVRQQSLES